MNYETTKEIEIAIARYFNTRKNVIVPNASWGIFKYELDLCILNTNMFASEVEIKISKSDLKADSKKKHHHDKNGNYIKYLWFAMPKKMKGCEEFVPENAGILYVNIDGHVSVFRKPTANKNAKKWTYENAFKLARLGTLRIWNLKTEILKLKEEKKKIKENEKCV